MKISCNKRKAYLMFGMLIGIPKRKRGLVSWLYDAQRVVFIAGAEAIKAGDRRIAARHLWSGMLQVVENNQPSVQYSLVGAIFKKLGVSLGGEVQENRNQMLHDKATMMKAKVCLGNEAKKVIQIAYKESFNLGHSYIGAGHLLLGLVGLNSKAQRDAIEYQDFDLQKVRDAFMDCLRSDISSL
ncbi:MAG TPA: Clp protease N-terminal domain-containing protein [Candidatus Omnitrophota bacterium]|nr:Clp protease N-terminal domain-containing protein [Candidatus Omnitrophota bacterium]